MMIAYIIVVVILYIAYSVYSNMAFLQTKWARGQGPTPTFMSVAMGPTTGGPGNLPPSIYWNPNAMSELFLGASGRRGAGFG